jgi:hypothetical protein
MRQCVTLRKELQPETRFTWEFRFEELINTVDGITVLSNSVQV